MTSHRDELQRHIDWLTDAIEAGGTGAEIAALVRERRLTVDALAALPADTEELSVADQLAVKRADRRAAAGIDAHASRRGQPRRRGRSNTAS